MGEAPRTLESAVVRFLPLQGECEQVGERSEPPFSHPTLAWSE